MHRSGTSIVTSLVERFGGRLASESDLLRGKEHHKPVRYRESRTVVDIDERILGRFGGDWAVPPTLPTRWWDSRWASSLAETARHRFWDVHPAQGWLVKDPRLCLTLPFWSTWVIPRVRTVLVVRRPRAVAASLARRDRIPIPYGIRLWISYTLGALRSCAGHPSFVLCYERLLQDPTLSAVLLRDWMHDNGLPRPCAPISDAVATVRSSGLPTPHPAPPTQGDAPTISDADHASLVTTADACYDAIAGMHGFAGVLPPAAVPADGGPAVEAGR